MMKKKKVLIKFQWDSIGTLDAIAYRAKVIGGWVFSDNNGTCFIPDPEHLWATSNLEM
jgi:hypothetical protein